MLGSDRALNSATQPLASKGRKSPSHGFGTQVAPVMATGLADLVAMLNVVGGDGTRYRGRHQNDLWWSRPGVDRAEIATGCGSRVRMWEALRMRRTLAIEWQDLGRQKG